MFPRVSARLRLPCGAMRRSVGSGAARRVAALPSSRPAQCACLAPSLAASGADAPSAVFARCSPQLVCPRCARLLARLGGSVRLARAGRLWGRRPSRFVGMGASFLGVRLLTVSGYSGPAPTGSFPSPPRTRARSLRSLSLPTALARTGALAKHRQSQKPEGRAAARLKHETPRSRAAKTRANAEC